MLKLLRSALKYIVGRSSSISIPDDATMFFSARRSESRSFSVNNFINAGSSRKHLSVANIASTAT